MEKAFGGPADAPPQANIPASQQRPSTPRTPRQLLRVGTPTGRTPRRSPRIARMSPRMVDDAALMDAFSESYPGIFENFEDLISSASPVYMEGLMHVGDTDFTANNYFANLSPVMPQLMTADGLLGHPFMASPVLAQRVLSPVTGHRARTGFTPQRGSPRLHMPTSTPSPYGLRSLTSPGRTGLTPRNYFAEFSDLMYQKPTQSSAKRDLLANTMFAAPAPATSTAAAAAASGQMKRSPSSEDLGKSKKAKKEKKQPRKTQSAPKRGEYRCGKCGFFPKKSKHNCQIEKAKRQAAEAQQGPQSASSRTSASSLASSASTAAVAAAPTTDPMMNLFTSTA